MAWMNELERIKQKEIEFLNNRIDKLTKERNMYRTQAMMRMNRIKELEDNERKILKESYDPSS
jgi:hypothetical protein